jgi:osomolarity two-component system sensor histidine kinase SLN1
VNRQKMGEPAFIRRPSGLSTCTYPSTAITSEDEGDMAQDRSSAPMSSLAYTNTPNSSAMPTPELEKGSDGQSIATITTSSASNATSFTSMIMGVSTVGIEEEIPEAKKGGEAEKESVVEKESKTEKGNDVEKGNSSSSSTPVPSAKRVIQRPTFVQLPSPRTFSLETQMPPISPSAIYTPVIGSSYSTTSTSPLAMFDANYARGSPSSLNAGMSFESVGMPVLVVDDDALTRTLMKKMLTRLGCEVSCAENGEVALEMILGRRISIPISTPSSDYSMTREMKPILEQEVSSYQSTSASTPPGSFEEYKYAVIFLDNQMPKMSGLKVVAKLRELERNDFVVGVTGTF